MTLKKCRLVFLSLAALTFAVGTAAGQWTLDPPGARQPVAPTTARIAPVPEAQWSEAQKQLVAKYASNGKADNALKTLLNLPELVDGVMPYTNYLLNESSLSPRQRELLVLRAAWLAGSQALWASHAPAAKAAGLDVKQIAQGADVAGWDPLEANLLRLADQLYRNSSVTGATWLSGT